MHYQCDNGTPLSLLCAASYLIQQLVTETVLIGICSCCKLYRGAAMNMQVAVQDVRATRLSHACRCQLKFALAVIGCRSSIAVAYEWGSLLQYSCCACHARDVLWVFGVAFVGFAPQLLLNGCPAIRSLELERREHVLEDQPLSSS